MKAKKHLGQHWLFDKPTLYKIVESAEVSKTDTVLEVGPGRGSLTEVLVEVAGQVIAVEFDSDLVPGLKANFATRENVIITEENILDYNLATLPKNYKVVANIPYYITSPIIQKFINSTNQPSVLVLLVQKEVAQRIVAPPGQMSVLAVSVQLQAEVELVANVGKELFQPPPEVDSAILKITPRNTPLFDVDEQQFFALVKAGFGEKRKKLRNSLAGGLHISTTEAEALLVSAQLSITARAQELSLQDWHKLYTAYTSKK
jgi:16S rRNA (adenine1518-N6/adenine1519-N6)-dimethyltransferase